MDRCLTAPEMKWKGMYRSNDFQYHLQWEFRMDTTTSNSSWMQDVLENFFGRLFDHSKSNNSNLIIACSTCLDMELQGINCGLKFNMLRRTNCVGFAKILNCSCVWCTKFLVNTTTGGSDLVRLKEEKIVGINTWDVLFQFFLPQADTTTNKLNQRKLITGRHRDKDILSCEKAHRQASRQRFPFLWKLKHHGQASRQRFPFLWLKQLRQQDKTSLAYWKGWNRSKIRLDPCISWLFGQIPIQSRRLAVGISGTLDSNGKEIAKQHFLLVSLCDQEELVKTNILKPSSPIGAEKSRYLVPQLRIFVKF
jgi:hypothetical protein